MDLMGVLHYVINHNQQVIGALIVVILVTAALLAWRASQEKSEGGVTTRGGGANLDIGAIEAAMKRVIAAGGLTSSASNLISTGVSTTGDASADVAERDSKIQELAREIDRLMAELAAATPSGGGFGGTAAATPDNAKSSELNAKIAELEGKLLEYEIIEDDIADLSRFKEENAELRAELASVKSGLPGSASVAATLDEPVEVPAERAAKAAPVEELVSIEDALTEAVEAETVAAASPVPPPAAKAAAPPKTDAESALKDFAASVEVQKPAKVDAGSDLIEAASIASLADGSSILDDSLDTEKMLSEVASLAEHGETSDDALSGELDTDKLLAEVGDLNSPVAVTPAPVAAPAPAAIPKQAPELVVESAGLEDDLLAEFKDGGGQG